MRQSRFNMRALALFGGIAENTGGIQLYSRYLLKAVQEAIPSLELELLLLSDSSVGPGPRGKITFAWRALRSAFTRRPDFVLCGHTNFLPLALAAGKLFRIPYILETHAWELSQADRVGLRPGLRSARRIHAASRFTQDLIQRMAPELDSIRVLPRPADFDLFTPGPPNKDRVEKLGLGGKKVLLTVGRLAAEERYKGHDKVIEAVSRLPGKHPDIRYLIIGGGDDKPRLESLARSCGVSDRTIFVDPGIGDDLADFYRLCDLFVMPSRFEGFGIVYLEALACGKPVIAGNADGARDALLDGELGLLVDPLDTDGLADAIDRMLSGNVKPSLRDPAFLRKTAMERFGYPAFRERVRDSLRGIGIIP